MAIRRADGRAPREMRPVSITWEKLARADGSARFAFGQTSALASLTGPTDVPPAREHPARAHIDVHARPLSGVPGPSSRQLAATIRGCLGAALDLGRYPRTMVQVVVQSLSSDAAEVKATGDESEEDEEGTKRKRRRWPGEYAPAHAASLNATSCASLNAGSVAAHGTLCAIALSRSSSGALYVDPTRNEWTEAEARGWFVFLVTRDAEENEESEDEEEEGLRCRAVWQSWVVAGGEEVEDGEVEEAREVAEEGAKEVWRNMRRAVGESYGEILRPVRKERKDVEMVESGESSEGSDESDEDEEKMEI
ncbi:hypothetical protein PENSPDRAFT_648131 [Peniophora sp. CONT]|nr:hypothetical protein PENSPDRAFT_648131 [Peniophora sp. CONT]